VTVLPSQKDNESAPNLYIEFEDDEGAAVSGEPGLVSDPEALGVPPTGLFPPRWDPGWLWATLPTRGRQIVTGVLVAAGLGAGVGDALAAQAAQRAAGQAHVALVDAAYSIGTDGSGLDLLINVTDTDSMPVTVLHAQVQGPGVDLRYDGIPLTASRAQELEVVLSGTYNCAAAMASSDTSAPDAPKVRLTVRTIHGTVDTLDLPLPPDAQLPGRWRGDRTTFCTWG
jgi:hypothetical protein